MGGNQSNEQKYIRKNVNGKIYLIPVVLPANRVHSSSSISTMDSAQSESLRSVSPVSAEPAIADDDTVMLSKLLETYDCGKLIGKGSSGHVFEVIDRETKEVYACKVIHKNFMMNDDGTMTTETEIMKRVSHENVASLHELYETTSSKWLVLELANAGTVQTSLATEENYNEQKIAKIFKDILLGVKYLHDMGIVHRDLKQDNILCSTEFNGDETEYKPKVADFGLSTIISMPEGKDKEQRTKAMKSYRKLRQMWGTTEYFAPEVYKKAYGPQADVWALGCVLYELLTGATPFPVKEKHASKLELWLLNGGQKIRRYFELNAAFDQLSPEARDLVQRMLKVNPAKRWSLEECLEHPWITGKSQQGAVQYPERILMEAKNTSIKRAHHKNQKNKVLTAELELRAANAAKANSK